MQKVAPLIVSTAIINPISNNPCITAIYKTWPKNLWNDAILTAQKESSLNPNAVGTPNNNGTIDYGCMQLNSYWQANFFKSYQWSNAYQNTAYAYQLYCSRVKEGLNGWSAWNSVYGILWR